MIGSACMCCQSTKFATVYYNIYNIEPFPPPNLISLSEIRFGPELIFNWTRAILKCQEISYTITSDCGNCPTTTTFSSALCRNVPTDGRVCSFAVKTNICGNIEGNHSSSISIKLKGIPIYSNYYARSIHAVDFYSSRNP